MTDDYCSTLGPRLRGLLSLQPDVKAITAPFLYQLHATAAWVIWNGWPLSWLVHAWSYPVWYVWQPYIVYRKRVAIVPHEPGTSGRRWRSIGTRY